jgi:chromate transporter
VTPGPIGINCATYVGYTVGGLWGSVLTTFAIVLPSLIIMLSICKAYFWLQKRFTGNPYFEQTLRALRFTVIGLVASAALLLMKPTTFIDPVSWIIFAVVALLTVSPEFIKNKVTDVISHPILLIVIAGIAGYCIYG